MTLLILNEKMDDIMKIIKSLKESDLLKKSDLLRKKKLLLKQFRMRPERWISGKVIRYIRDLVN